MSIDVLDLRNASLSDEAREKLCWRYYERVYKPAFPRLDEAEDPCVWLPLLTGAHQDGKPFLYILLAIPGVAGFGKLDAFSVNGLSPLGGIHAEYFPLSHTALITYLCVVPEMRRRGISELLLGQIVSVLRKNAAEASIPIFAEAEDPAKLPDSASQQTAYRRYRS